jgi:DNA helicase MCM9
MQELKPVLTDQANEVLSRYYQVQRKSEMRDAARSTVRLLESLIRLSEGHARLMCRDKVILHDALTAITLIESSMQGSALISEIDTLHTTFPADPMEEYRSQGNSPVLIESVFLFRIQAS